jgi:hypothetical protein
LKNKTFIVGDVGEFGPFFCFSFFFLGMMVTLVTSQNWPLKTHKKKPRKEERKKTRATTAT